MRHDRVIKKLLKDGIIEVLDAPNFDEPIYLFPVSYVLNRFRTTDSDDECGCCDCDGYLDCVCECLCASDLEEVLEKKAGEEEMDDALAYLEEGFRLPIVCILSDSGYFTQYNGHHRLAAAIDLGYEQVPYLVESESHAKSLSYERRKEYYNKLWQYSEELEEYGDKVLVPNPYGD